MLTIRQMRNVVRTVRISDAVAPIRYGTHSIPYRDMRSQRRDVTVKMWRGVVRKAARFVTYLLFLEGFRAEVLSPDVQRSSIGDRSRTRDRVRRVRPPCGPRCGRGCVCTSEGSLPRRWLGA